MRGRRKKIDNNYIVFYIAIIIASIISSVFIYRTLSIGVGREHIVTATVTEKGIKRINDSDVYLIYAKTNEKPEVFQITDSLVGRRFNSSDLYAEIEPGKTYQFTVRGDRNRYMSWYPNIYGCKELDTSEEP